MIIYLCYRKLDFFWLYDLFCIRRMMIHFLLRLKWLRIIFTFTLWFRFGCWVKIFLPLKMILLMERFLVVAVVLCFWRSTLDDRYMLFISLRRSERHLFMLFSIWFRLRFRSRLGFRFRIRMMRGWVRIFHIMKIINWIIDITYKNIRIFQNKIFRIICMYDLKIEYYIYYKIEIKNKSLISNSQWSIKAVLQLIA